eukprot:6652881-Pyramimonas_sp.AAC.1
MRFLVDVGAFVGVVAPGRVAPVAPWRMAGCAVSVGTQLLGVMLLLLVPSFISSVEGALWPGEAPLALAIAPVLVAGSGLRPRRRAGAFYQTHPCFLADVYAAVREDPGVLDIVE